MYLPDRPGTPLVPAPTTVPANAAYTGVPALLAISIPAWNVPVVTPGMGARRPYSLDTLPWAGEVIPAIPIPFQFFVSSSAAFVWAMEMWTWLLCGFVPVYVSQPRRGVQMRLLWITYATRGSATAAAQIVAAMLPVAVRSSARTTPVFGSGLWSDVLAAWARSPMVPSDTLDRSGHRVFTCARSRTSEGARYQGLAMKRSSFQLFLGIKKTATVGRSNSQSGVICGRGSPARVACPHTVRRGG